MRHLIPSFRTLSVAAVLVARASLVLAQATAAPAAPAGAPAPATTGPAPAPVSAPSPAAAAAAAPASTQIDVASDSFDFAKALGQGQEPLSADEAAAIAVKTGPSVARAEAVAEQARRAASQSVVGLYPRLDLIAQYTRLSSPPVISYSLGPTFNVLGDVVGGFCMSNPTNENCQAAAAAAASGNTGVTFPLPLVNQYLLQARASYPVSDLFFAILPRYKAAKETAHAQELNAKAAGLTVGLSAREAYYNYARARAAALVARFSLSQADAQLKDVQSLVAAGTQARVEQMRAEANVAAAQVTVARSEGSVAVARTALRTLLHRDGDAEIAILEDFAQPLPPVTEEKEQLIKNAFANRSELRALDMTAAAQLRSVHANDADKLPKITISAQAEEGNPNQRAAMFDRKWTGTWEAMATLSWSPNDLALGYARGGQVEAQRAQTLADMAALEDALRREVSQAYEDYKAAHQAMTAALTGIAAAEESYRVRREQFRAGAAVATDVIISENELNRARLDLINASIDLRIARARLDRAVERGTSS